MHQQRGESSMQECEYVRMYINIFYLHSPSQSRRTFAGFIAKLHIKFYFYLFNAILNRP